MITEKHLMAKLLSQMEKEGRDKNNRSDYWACFAYYKSMGGTKESIKGDEIE